MVRLWVVGLIIASAATAAEAVAPSTVTFNRCGLDGSGWRSHVLSRRRNLLHDAPHACSRKIYDLHPHLS